MVLTELPVLPSSPRSNPAAPSDSCHPGGAEPAADPSLVARAARHPAASRRRFNGRLAASGLLFAVGLAACGGSNKAPDVVPSGLTAVAGDTSVTLTWNQDAGYTYWLFQGQGTGISPKNWTTFPGANANFPASSPSVVIGLVNGKQYSFTITATTGGPQGPGAPSVEATPRPAGATWTPGAPLANALLSGLAFNSVALWVTAGLGGAVFSSPDGVTWTAQTSNVTADLNAATFGTGRFVVAGTAGAVSFSTDAVTWTAANVGTPVTLNGLAAGSSLYIAVGAGGAIFTSSDAATWTAQNSGTTADLYGVGNLNGTFVAVGAGGTLLTSTDAANWTARGSGTTAALRAAAYGNGSYVVVGDGGTVLKSTDAVSWAGQPSPGAENLRAVNYVTQWVMGGSAGAVYYGADASSWTRAVTGTTAELRGLLWGSRRIVAVGSAGANLVSQ